MKKVFGLLLILFVVLTLGACAKKSPAQSSSVQGWKIYTNPAYRYELRFPKDWTTADSGENGYVLNVYPEGQTNKGLVFKAYSNWQQKYSLTDFYKNQTENLWSSDYKRDDMEVGGKKGYLFKAVKGRIAENPEVIVDVIALELPDSILEIEIKNPDDSVSQQIIKTIQFYGNKIIDNL